MSIRIQLLILGFVLFLIILLSLSSTGFVPFSKDTLFSHEYPYEGLSNFAENAGKLSEDKKSDDKKKDVKHDDKKKDNKKKVEGFEGLKPAPFDVEPSLDIFSKLPSNINCKSQYSNSQGQLCLDKQATELLQTRGGNSTGKDSQIGSP